MKTRSHYMMMACATAIALSMAARADEDADTTTGSNVILNTRTFWRFCTVRETQEVVDKEGNIVYGWVSSDFKNETRIHSFFRANPDQPSLPQERWTIKTRPADQIASMPSNIPAGWMRPDFNDSDWSRSRGPMLDDLFLVDQGWKLILMRSAFEIKDMDKAKDLKLSMTFRGGAIIYLNGKEVLRKHMPEGPINLSTPATPYSPDADFTEAGFLLPYHDQTSERAKRNLSKDILDRVGLRTRGISEAVIPATALRKGINVLAIGLHRAPTPAVRYVTRDKGRISVHESFWWNRLGLLSIKLTTGSNAAVVPNIEPQPGLGFMRWNQSIVQGVNISDYPDPFNSHNPIPIAATRNGAFSGQIVVGDNKPIKDLRVDISDLNGPGRIPKTAVQVRYGHPDGIDNAFDSLEDTPRSVIPVGGHYNRSVQPIWITVQVPADATAGLYEGDVVIRAADVEPRRAKLHVQVSGWNMPPAKDFTARMDVIQSPESVAMAYDVPLWSDEHFALLDKSFALIGGLGGKSLYITGIPRTHFGNEHAMLRWVRDKETFELQPDFTIIENYLDTAIKHMGQIPGIVLYAWEPPYSQGHAGGAGTAGRTHDKPLFYTLYNPDTGDYTTGRGPAWGTREATEHWEKVNAGMFALLKQRGLEDSLLFGLAGDHRPTRQAMDDISSGTPDARWAIHSHYRCEVWQGYPMGLFNALWGVGCGPMDPNSGYGLGWTNPKWLSYYPRNNLNLFSTITKYRCMLEAWIGAYNTTWPTVATGRGVRGLGRIGADFWRVVKDRRGRSRGTLAGRYPESAWGQLNLNFAVPHILGRGKAGPVATVRSEAFRESVQEVEARVYLEKAWLDPRAQEIIGDELVREIRQLLDARIRVLNITASQGDAAAAWFISSGWRERNQQLFDLAAKVQERYGNKHPTLQLDNKEKHR